MKNNENIVYRRAVKNAVKKQHQRLVRPSEVEEAAKRKEKENLRFRSFLKRVADPDILDRQFLALHQEIFPKYSCAECRNCCKRMNAEIPEEDIERDAAYLGMTREAFIAAHLKRENGEWLEFHRPCGFLDEAGNCVLGENKPDSCRKFPYTDQPERLFSLFSFLNAVGVCPAAYEICEGLKQIYGFGQRRRQRDHADSFDDQAPGFSFVAGHTGCGFPYGVLEASGGQNDADDDLPF